MEITFRDPVMHHARGAWGTITHSQSGTIVHQGERLDWHAFRYFDRDGELNKRTSYAIELRRPLPLQVSRIATGRELTAAKWDGLKIEIRRRFIANVRELAEAAGACTVTTRPRSRAAIRQAEIERQAAAPAPGARIAAAAAALLDAFGGDVPDWLRTEAGELAAAIGAAQA